jgi:hypothetical protein
MQVAPNTLVSIPAVGQLCGRDRKWAWRCAKRARFGALTWHGGDIFVTLAGVEAAMGREFSEAQLKAAGVRIMEESTMSEEKKNPMSTGKKGRPPLPATRLAAARNSLE